MNKFNVGNWVVRTVASFLPEVYGRVGEVGLIVSSRGNGEIDVPTERLRVIMNTHEDYWSFYTFAPYTEEDLESIIG